MYTIYFYRDKSGKEPAREYMRELARQNTKDARIRLKKMQDYINVLAAYGTRAGEAYTKKIDDEIWELRPTSDRVYLLPGSITASSCFIPSRKSRRIGRRKRRGGS